MNKGDIYTAKFKYGNPIVTKERPVVIVDIDRAAGFYYVVEITSQGPDDPPTYHDKFKVPIYNWRRAGLNKPSWAKTYDDNIHELKAKDLYDYRGRMNPIDLKRILNVL